MLERAGATISGGKGIDRVIIGRVGGAWTYLSAGRVGRYRLAYIKLQDTAAPILKSGRLSTPNRADHVCNIAQARRNII